MMTMCWRNLLLVSSSQISSFSSSTTLSSFTTFHCSMMLLIMVVFKMMRMVVLVTMVVNKRRWTWRPWTIFTVLVVSSELFSALSTPVQIISAWKHRQDEFDQSLTSDIKDLGHLTRLWSEGSEPRTWQSPIPHPAGRPAHTLSSNWTSSENLFCHLLVQVPCQVLNLLLQKLKHLLKLLVLANQVFPQLHIV